jgi:3-oxoadipate enol-lactonase
MAITTGRIGKAPAIAIRHCGKGELILFLHGIGGNSLNWLDQLPVFGKRYLAAAWDARGYGESDDYEGPASFGAFSSDVLRILGHFEVEKAHIFGLSLGGRIAQRFYTLHPKRVTSLILADTRTDGMDTRSPEEREAFFAARAKPILEGKTPADIAEQLVPQVAGRDVHPDLTRRLIESMSLVRGESYLKTVRANLDDFYLGPAVPVTVPTLVVVGANDIVTPPHLSQQLAREIVGSELAILPNAGHLSNMDQPAAFNRAVLSFLERIKR